MITQRHHQDRHDDHLGDPTNHADPDGSTRALVIQCLTDRNHHGNQHPDIRCKKDQSTQQRGGVPRWSRDGQELFYRIGSGAYIARNPLPWSPRSVGSWRSSSRPLSNCSYNDLISDNR